MKIYYDVDGITDNCMYDCPFKDLGYKGEIGEDCKVGSVTCQECKFCYGHHNPFKQELGMIFVDGKLILKPIRYVKCMWGIDNPWKEKIQQFFYRIIYWMKNDFD